MSVVGVPMAALALACSVPLFAAVVLVPGVRAGSAVGYGAQVTSSVTAGIATSATSIEFALTTTQQDVNIRSAVVAVPLSDTGQNTSESVTLSDGQTLAEGSIPFSLGDSTAATLPGAHYDILAELQSAESSPGHLDAGATSLGHAYALSPGRPAQLAGTLTAAGGTLDLMMVLPPTSAPASLSGGTLTLGATGAQ